MAGEKIDITPNKDGGVLKVITKEGVGSVKPTPGCNVRVHYVGRLESGEVFDSSRDRNDEFSFTVGEGQVIKGWDIGILTMHIGEVAEFTIRSEYAYGSSGSPPKIPGGATLIFEIEMVSWTAEDISPERDGTIIRKVIQQGEKLANPNETSSVQVHIVGAHEDRTFFDSDITFTLGEASEVGLPEGVDRALRRFCKGEKSVVELKGTRYTYGQNPPEQFNLPPNAPLTFTMFLKEYEKVPATWEMTGEQKLEAAKVAKERGTHFLTQGKLRLALNKYKRVEELLEFEKSMDPEKTSEKNALVLAAYLNMSLTASKMGEQAQCIKYCDKALDIAPDNVKALFRKAGAKFASNEPEEALTIYEGVIAIEPDNKAAQQQVLVCKRKIKDLEEADKKRFRKLFSKMSPEEPEEKTIAGGTTPLEVEPSTSSSTA